MIFRTAKVIEINLLIAFDSLAAHDLRRPIQIAEWCKAGICHVVEFEGRIIAYGVLHYHFFDNGFIEILMIDEGMRRKNVGLTLVEYFKSLCQRPKLFTSTNRSNQPMVNLLLKAGFIESGCIENLDEGDPEMVFFFPVKEISGNRAD